MWKNEGRRVRKGERAACRLNIPAKQGEWGKEKETVFLWENISPLHTHPFLLWKTHINIRKDLRRESNGTEIQWGAKKTLGRNGKIFQLVLGKDTQGSH